jgi:hypothetical protein
MTDAELWTFLPFGYIATIAVELPILWWGLSRRHPSRDRLIAGLWLTACTYPIVILVLPALMLPEFSRTAYLAVAETFAPVAECVLFWLAYIRRLPPDRISTRRDFMAIVAANLASFGFGELLDLLGWLS